MTVHAIDIINNFHTAIKYLSSFDSETIFGVRRGGHFPIVQLFLEQFGKQYVFHYLVFDASAKKNSNNELI